MIKFSKNKKLNGVLNDIYNSLEGLGFDEVKHYYNNFKGQNISDYNIAQYGNLLIYYNDVRKLYVKNGYKSIKKFSDTKIWEIYKGQVGFITRFMLGKGTK